MKRAAWIFLACFGWSGCAGTETGNPSFDGTLGYDAYSSRPDRVALRANAVTRVDSAWFVLGEVDFATPAECVERAAAAAHVDGLGAGDHAATQAPPTRFAFDPGRYCEVRLRIDPAMTRPDGAPAELAGRSFLIRGVLPDGRSFELASVYSGLVRLDARASEFVLDEEQSSVVLGFDLAAWLGEIEWPSGSGTIRVDDQTNVAILRGFESRIPRGIALFRDEDGDGELDLDPIELARAAE